MICILNYVHTLHEININYWCRRILDLVLCNSSTVLLVKALDSGNFCFIREMLMKYLRYTGEEGGINKPS